MSTRKIRILIVDDHVILRRGLAMVLQQKPIFDVVGEVENGCQALDIVNLVHPHVVLLDLVMPVMDGVATAMALRSSVPDLPILVLTGMELQNGFPKILTRVLSAGIRNYIPKEASPEDMYEAIQTIAQGETYVHPKVTHLVLGKKKSGNGRHTLPPTVAAHTTLTPREQEVLQWMATPSTYREIAENLALSEETVRCHAKKILTKLHQPNRFQAVLEAMRYGFIELSR